MLRSTLAYLFVGLYILILSPIAIGWSALRKDTTLLYRLARLCIRVAGEVCGVKVDIRGREKVQPGETYVFLSNHQGNCDAPVLAHAIPRDFRALIKKEVMRIPVLASLLRFVQFVPVDRLDPNQSRASIDRGTEMLRDGYSFVAFPEGTRSRNGRLGEFKKGVFIMALKANKPIVPISIVNSDFVLPPGGYTLRPGRIGVIFHDPIPTADMTLNDRNRLIAMTRAAIETGLRRPSAP